MTTLPEGPATPLQLPFPECLPWRRADLASAVGVAAAALGPAPFRDFAVFEGREAPPIFWGRQWVVADDHDGAPGRTTGRERPADGAWIIGPPTEQAQAEQVEHDRYFHVRRDDGGAPSFVAGLLAVHLTAAGNAAAMGLTLLDEPGWQTLHDGISVLFETGTAGHAATGGTTGAADHATTGRTTDAADQATAGTTTDETATTGTRVPMPGPAGWRPAGYDPAARWLIGHQLFFALIQGAVVGLNIFAAATAGQAGPTADHAGTTASQAGPATDPNHDADHGLRLAAAFLRSSAAAMRFASDFDPVDYESTVRKDMAPPKVREGFSGFQTRDHAHMVRLLTALRPMFATGSGGAAHQEIVDAVSNAYASHEFICARFRGDVLPSLRMAAASRGLSDRPGVEVVRELMRKRLGLLTPAAPEAGA